MKNFIATLAFCCICSIAFSQSLLSKLQSSTAAQKLSASSLPALSNITGAANGIMDKLSPALSLTTIEKPQVSSLVTGFLKDKVSLLPLLNTNKPAYTSKFSALQTGFLAKLKPIITAAQYSQFLGLKPQVANAANVLSNLFY